MNPTKIELYLSNEQAAFNNIKIKVPVVIHFIYQDLKPMYTTGFCLALLQTTRKRFIKTTPCKYDNIHDIL